MENLNELIQKAQRGDKDSFAQIYRLYFRKIYRYCRINLKNQTEAEDIAQETFLKAWRSISTFSSYHGSSVQAFLFRIARNLMIDLSRKKTNLSLDSAMEVASKDNIEDELEKETNIERVKKALSEIKEDDRQLVILRFFEEMSNGEIAEVVGSNEGAVRVRLHRILKKLKEII